jgi:aspartate aminotransferase
VTIHIPLLENRIGGVQTLSGTGGLRVFGEMLRKHGHKHIYVPNPTWGNHIPIMQNSGLEVQEVLLLRRCNIRFGL